MRFTKNASLNLSINAIVILILAITMLGLGLGFMRNIFGGATKQFEEMTGTVYKQMLEDMKASNEIVQINRPKIEISPGEIGQVFIGFRNVGTADVDDFEVTNAECTKLGDDPDCEGVEALLKESETTVPSGSVGIVPLNIEVDSTEAGVGTYFFDIEISADGENYYLELTVDVIV